MSDGVGLSSHLYQIFILEKNFDLQHIFPQLQFKIIKFIAAFQRRPRPARARELILLLQKASGPDNEIGICRPTRRVGCLGSAKCRCPSRKARQEEAWRITTAQEWEGFCFHFLRALDHFDFHRSREKPD